MTTTTSSRVYDVCLCLDGEHADPLDVVHTDDNLPAALDVLAETRGSWAHVVERSRVVTERLQVVGSR